MLLQTSVEQGPVKGPNATGLRAEAGGEWWSGAHRSRGQAAGPRRVFPLRFLPLAVQEEGVKGATPSGGCSSHFLVSFPVKLLPEKHNRDLSTTCPERPEKCPSASLALRSLRAGTS